MTVRARDSDRDEPDPLSTVLLSAESRALRRRLHPLAWMALEEVALDAVAEEGRFVARTSARRVAELLQVDPGSAARALRVLREHGLVALEREKGSAGRFGLSVYVLGAVAGLTVLGRGAVEPRPELPSLDEPDVGQPHAAAAGTKKPCTDGPYGAGPALALPSLVLEHAGQERGLRPAPAAAPVLADRPQKSALPAAPAVQIPGQGTLDLDGGIA
jgi:DNA-binding transcriptional ArsR family regulator